MKEVKGFQYHKTPRRFVAEYADGAWDKGRLTRSANISLNESACVLQYAQTCFEGLKAYRTEKGRIVCFRPDLNDARLKDSCLRMVMPPLPDGMFCDAVKKVVAANRKFVPPYESGGALYLRPFVFGKNAVLGVKPATAFEFRMFASPVGSYFSGGARPLTLRITDFDRAAPHGTGHVKAGLNYAMSLYAITDAHKQGFDENVYLDSATRTYIEETGGANLLFVTKDHKLVTPKSPTILPSITRRSLLTVAAQYLSMETEERPVRAEELTDFAECGLCGTAAVISPVGKIVGSDTTYTFDESATLMKLRETLLDIQHEKIEAPKGWIFEID